MTRRWIARACALVTLVSLARAEAGGFVLLKNAKNPTPSLTKDVAKAVFNGHTKEWSNGEAVVLVIGSEDSPAMGWLATTLFGASAKTYLAKLKQDVFKGDVRHPVSADDDAKTIKRVEAGAGVVGFVSDDGAKALPAGVAVLPLQ
jgi:ABC-type phosphate transport system substrate-binding protein